MKRNWWLFGLALFAAILTAATGVMQIIWGNILFAVLQFLFTALDVYIMKLSLGDDKR